MKNEQITKEDLRQVIREENKNLVEKVVSMEGRLEKVEENMSTKEGLSALHGAVDTYIKQNVDREQEEAMLNGRLKRYDRWFEQIASKLGLELKS